MAVAWATPCAEQTRARGNLGAGTTAFFFQGSSPPRGDSRITASWPPRSHVTTPTARARRLAATDHRMAARAPLVMPHAAACAGPLPAAATVAPRQSAQCLRPRGAVGGLFFDQRQRTERPVRHLLPDAKFGAIGRYPNPLCRFDTVSPVL
jgi:hypothetical protein